MTMEEVIENELKCVQRNCCRLENECAKCDLVLPLEEIINAYNEALRLKKENTELKEQNTNLQEMLKTERSVTCKEEYLKKVTEIEQENAELKAQIESERDLPAIAYQQGAESYKRKADKQLIKAKELLLELYDCIPSSMADSCKETLQKVALFFKDSEVKK